MHDNRGQQPGRFHMGLWHGLKEYMDAQTANHAQRDGTGGAMSMTVLQSAGEIIQRDLQKKSEENEGL